MLSLEFAGFFGRLLQLPIWCAQVDDEGNALVAGYTKSSRLDGHSTPGHGWASGFLMKFNSQGVYQWTRVHSGERDARPTSLQADRL